MNPADLTDPERQALYGLLVTVADADGRIEEGELDELDALAEELDVDLYSAMATARELVPDLDRALALAGQVVRPEARTLIRTLLSDLAQGDGERSETELAVLAGLARIW